MRYSKPRLSAIDANVEQAMCRPQPPPTDPGIGSAMVNGVLCMFPTMMTCAPSGGTR